MAVYKSISLDEESDQLVKAQGPDFSLSEWVRETIKTHLSTKEDLLRRAARHQQLADEFNFMAQQKKDTLVGNAKIIQELEDDEIFWRNCLMALHSAREREKKPGSMRDHGFTVQRMMEIYFENTRKMSTQMRKITWTVFKERVQQAEEHFKDRLPVWLKEEQKEHSYSY